MKTGNKVKHQKNKSTDLKELIPAIFLGVSVFLLLPLLYFKTAIEPVIYPRFFAMALILLFTILYFAIVYRYWSNLKLFHSWFFISVLSYLLVTIMGFIYAVNPVEGLYDLLKWILFILLSWMIFEVLSRNPGSFSLWMKVIILNAAIALIIGVVQYFKNSFQSTDPNALYEVSGLMAHKNQYVISLFLMWPFVFVSIFWLAKTWRKIAIVEAIVIGLAILFLQTRSVWMAILIAGTITALAAFLIKPINHHLKLNHLISRKLIFILVGVIIIAAGIYTLVPKDAPGEKLREKMESIFDEGNASNAWRLEMWEATFDLANDNLIKGVGAGNWKLTIYPYYSRFLPSVYRHWRSPHNDFLLIASEKGFPGLLAYLSLFASLFYYLLKLLSKAKEKKEIILFLSLFFGLCGYLVISFFSFPYERINPFLFLSLISGVILVHYFCIGNETKKQNKLASKWIGFPIAAILGFIVYFGWVGLNMEFNLALAQSAEAIEKWNLVKRYALKAQHALNPIEPRNSFPAVNYLGLAYFHEDKDYEKALQCFKVANLQHPTSIGVLNNMGSTYGKLAQYDSALMCYWKTLEIFPHYEFGLLNSSRAYFLLGEYDQAYRCILSCDPKSSTKDIAIMRKVIEEKLMLPASGDKKKN